MGLKVENKRVTKQRDYFRLKINSKNKASRFRHKRPIKKISIWLPPPIST